MSVPRTVVVATDFSEQAEKATRYARELAGRLDARLRLVHTWSVPIVGYPDLMVPVPQDAIDDLEKYAQRTMDEAVRRHATAGIRVDGTVVCGDARETVIDTVESLGADLLVVGTHGRRGLTRALLGSVAEYAVRHAKCPVLVVR